MRREAEKRAEPQDEQEKLIDQDTETPEGPGADAKNLDGKQT